MTDKEIEEIVIAIVAEQLGVEAANITLDSRFTEDLNADSLDSVELIMALEDRFGISVPDEDAGNLRSVGDVVAYIKTNTK